MDDDPADLEAAMAFPVTASLGPAGPLLKQLHEGVSEDEICIESLTENLDGLCVSLMHQSEAEAEEPLSFTAKFWMREVRELCYDTKSYFDDAQFTPEEKQENAQFEFEMLKARAEHAKETRQRYGIDHKSVNKTTKLLPSTGRRLSVRHPKMIDREEMYELAGKLRKDEEKELKVVSLVGVEGVGKTTLAKRLYHQIKTGGQFDCGAFVRVSPNPDMRRLLTTIFTQIQSPPGSSSSSSSSSSSEGVTQPASCFDAQDFIRNIQDYLRDKRYLIIIDDLWSTSAWDIIRRAFPDGGCHSRIITTTQFEDVASACCSYQSMYKIEVKPLKYDQSLKLFYSMVFGSEDKVSFPEGFEKVSSEIIERCGGLPLSIINIASLLPTEERELNLQQWEGIRDSLRPIQQKEVVNLIYNNLSPELKTCLLYLVMNPEGYTVSKDDMVKQWVIEGFIREGQNKEEIAGGHFDELVRRGMIQAVDINYRGVLSCTLHHMVHDLIVKKSVEENFIVIVDCFQSAIGLPDKVRRLSVQFGGARSACIPVGIMMSEVRSLAFFGFYGCVDFIEECKLLRVLILHVWADQDKVPFDLSGIISKLLPLRYVKITCNITVKLPAKIQDLQFLETLEVDTPVVAIPSDIGGLSRLSSLKIAVRELSREEICILQKLRALTALSLHVWTTPVEMIVFDKGGFLVLKSFEFRCPVPWLKFEAGSMPDLRNLNLCFNAGEADQHDIVPLGMEQLSGLKEITAHIWGSDTDVGSAFRTAISNHPSNPRIYMQLVDPIFHGDTTTSVGTIEVEDEKKQAADIRMSTLPRSKRMLNLPGSSSRVPMQGGSNNMVDGPSRVLLHSLESMTDNFSEGRLLGSGSYGKVYLGLQEDGQNIAIKILHEKLGHDDVQFEKEFYNLANLQHQNIVRLVGYCHETRRKVLPYNESIVLAEVTTRALCFEFMENGSLSDYLFDEFNGHGWRQRYDIIKGICNGLKYLHEELKPPIFHLDLKPANILLDKNMIPKIADFGLSRFLSHITNSPIGTLGYLPPEFIHHGIISKKGDIFSLGVVVIKIIAGPTGHCRSAEMTSEQFIEIVHGNWRNRLQSAASGDLLESYSEQVKICILIALSCVENDRQKRPTIGDIVNMLTETETIENYHGALIDQMSTCIVKDTELIDVHPLQLHYSFRPNKFISCPFHVTNNMDDQHVSVRCVPKHEEATRYYHARLSRIVGVVPPRSTHTFVVTMKEVQQPPANMDVLDIVVETILGEVLSSDYWFEAYFKDARKENSRGFREVTLKAVCATTCEKTTSEVILHDGDYDVLRSMDVHPTEPWILAAYARGLVIWNYKTQTKMMEREFYPGLAHSLRNFVSSGVEVRTVRFIVQSTEQLFVVGDGHGYIHVYECMAMKRVKEFKAHGRAVTSFAVHPTQPFVLSASYDQLIKLWNWEKGWECIRTFTGHSDEVNQVKFNPHDANSFASSSCDGTLKIWRIFSPIHVTSLDCDEGQACVDYYPTGGDQQHYMVTGSELGMARIWDLRTQTCIREIKGLQSPCIVGVIDCHPDHPAVLVTASESYGVFLHDSTTYRCERTVHFGLGSVRCFAYIKGIRSLAIGHVSGVAIVEIDEFSKNVLPPAR